MNRAWWFDDEPDDDDEDLDLGRKLTAAEAHVELGLNQGTVRSWACRSSTGLHAVAKDGSGRSLYWEADLIAAAAGVPIWDSRGRRILRSIPTFRESC